MRKRRRDRNAKCLEMLRTYACCVQTRVAYIRVLGAYGCCVHTRVTRVACVAVIMKATTIYELNIDGQQVRGLRRIPRGILTPVCGAESPTASCRHADMDLNTACHTNRPSPLWRSPRQYWVHLRPTPSSQPRTGTHVRRTSARSR